MNRYIKLFVLTSLLFVSCNPDSKKAGLHGFSQSIDESVKHRLFRYKIYADNPVINLGNNTDTIKEAWVERAWTYDGSGNIKEGAFDQTLIRLKNLSIDSTPNTILKYHGNYFGWNRLYYDTLREGEPVFVLLPDSSLQVALDTIYFTRKKS